MTPVELITALHTVGCRLIPEGEHLRVQDPRHALTDDVRQAIREHKAALLAWLTQSAPAHNAAATAPSTQEVCPEQAHASLLPPPYPGSPLGAPFRPGDRVWLYRWDDHTPRFNTPALIVQMRALWPGEQDIGWRNTAGALSWHTARLAVAVETKEGRSPSPGARQA
jgi:hypothetical protein